MYVQQCHEHLSIHAQTFRQERESGDGSVGGGGDGGVEIGENLKVELFQMNQEQCVQLPISGCCWLTWPSS